MGKKRRERGEVGPDLCRRTRELVFFTLPRLGKILTGHGIASAEHVTHPGDASVGFAKCAAACQGIGDDRVGGCIFAQTKERARPLPANRKEPGLLQRRGMTRDVRLTFPEELGQLEDRELFFRAQGEEPQPRRLGEHAVEIPPGRRHGSVEHELLIT